MFLGRLIPAVRVLGRRAKSTAASYYNVLGVSERASAKDIKQAYHELCRRYHPDISRDDPKIFTMINEAYSTLSEPLARRQYDFKQGLYAPPQPPYPNSRPVYDRYSGVYEGPIDTGRVFSHQKVRTLLDERSKEAAENLERTRKTALETDYRVQLQKLRDGGGKGLG